MKTLYVAFRKREERRLKAQDQRAREVHISREHEETLKRLQRQTPMERNFHPQKRRNMVGGGRETSGSIHKHDGTDSVRVNLLDDDKLCYEGDSVQGGQHSSGIVVVISQ